MRKPFLLLFILLILSCTEEKKLELDSPKTILSIDHALAMELSRQISSEVSVELKDDFSLDLWAADTIVKDPIAISIDKHGAIYYTQANRLSNSEFDIRGHKDWMTASISFESPEDRRAFLRKTFSETNEQGKKHLKDLNQDGVLDWRDLTVEKEQIWIVSDENKDGFAEQSQLFIEGFHEEISDLANGVEVHNGDVFLSVGPDLWRINDTDNDNFADVKESISHGWAVHIGFGAHGMSGTTIGPDGRIWWGIGDIGMHVTDKEGRVWKNPNSGVIARSERDGSNFEIYCYGVRNTHEFDFDKYGNLITVDNDGDHEGERERLVYLLNGSDTGWRINWQFGKYTDPLNNKYKVWMDEKLGVPRWDGQAAYILPCIQNYVNGPTGFIYNPGTALGERYYNKFFVAEFRGTPSSSPIHAFELEPKGASFTLKNTEEIVKGLLPSGIDFAPDGALYFADWINGWGTKNQGRIWKLDVAGEEETKIRKSTKLLLESDFGGFGATDLAELLGHQDMRVRKNAQFELVDRKELDLLVQAAKTHENQLGRIHGIWGIAQSARLYKTDANMLIHLLQDSDREIVNQAIKMIGDIQLDKGELLIPFLSDPSLRIQLHAAEALGRLEYKDAVDPLIEMLRKNNDVDSWLRQAGIIALGRINNADAMAALKNDASKAVRIAAVVALRRMRSPRIAEFLNDPDEYIVTEAARGINDDYSIPEALPELARCLTDMRFTNEALLRRAINANLRVGEIENINFLLAYAQEPSAPAAMRAEALEALSTWSKPSLHDRVDGRYRGPIVRDITPLENALFPNMTALLNSDEALVQVAAIQTALRLKSKEHGEQIYTLLTSSSSAEVRAKCIEALAGIQSENLAEAMQFALQDKSSLVRARVLEYLPDSEVDSAEATDLYSSVIATGSVPEMQAAYAGLASLSTERGMTLLKEAFGKLKSGTLAKEVQLDAIEAIKASGNENLMEDLEAYFKKDENPLAEHMAALYGGDKANGRNIFYEHEQAQCTRCHTVFEYGGNAGPSLTGLADKMSDEKILESLVLPSAELAAGFGIAYIETKEGEFSGTILKEDAKSITISSKNEAKTFLKSEMSMRENLPSSMPPVTDILTAHELRDLLAFLKDLKLD